MEFYPSLALAAGLLAASATLAGPEVAGLRAPHERAAILALADELELWLDRNTDLPRSDIPLARVELVRPGAEIRHEGRLTALGDTVRGVYDAETATIYLVRQWFGDTVRDRSILLHELVHHRQARAKHWYCPQAMEWDAYLIQEDYLDAHGTSGDFDWAWVLLASSCAVRDHHPD